tara:strand:+ start:861 stop:1052 length:192 start_codon:yes stop_codon:yes gene_type:complete
MLVNEEISQLRIMITKQNQKIEQLKKIRNIAMIALEAIEETGQDNIAGLAMSEIDTIQKFPND